MNYIVMRMYSSAYKAALCCFSSAICKLRSALSRNWSCHHASFENVPPAFSYTLQRYNFHSKMRLISK